MRKHKIIKKIEEFCNKYRQDYIGGCELCPFEINKIDCYTKHTNDKKELKKMEWVLKKYQ